MIAHAIEPGVAVHLAAARDLPGSIRIKSLQTKGLALQTTCNGSDAAVDVRGSGGLRRVPAVSTGSSLFIPACAF